MKIKMNRPLSPIQEVRHKLKAPLKLQVNMFLKYKLNPDNSQIRKRK